MKAESKASTASASSTKPQIQKMQASDGRSTLDPSIKKPSSIDNPLLKEPRLGSAALKGESPSPIGKAKTKAAQKYEPKATMSVAQAEKLGSSPKIANSNVAGKKPSTVPVTHAEEAAAIDKLQTGTRKDGKPYHPRYVQNQTGGIKGEVHPRRTLERAGYKIHKTGDKTIDTVATKTDSKGKVTDLIIVESKYRAKGTPKLKKQMTDDWIEGNIENMLDSPDPAVRATGKMLDANRHLIRRKTNLKRPDGSNKWGVPKLPPTTKYKE